MSSSSNKKSVPLFGIPIALVSGAVILACTTIYHIDFYFDGSLQDYKIWFPHLYIVAFLFFKLFLPIFFGAFLLSILYSWAKTHKGLFCLTIAALSVVIAYAQSIRGFSHTLILFLVLCLFSLIFIFSESITSPIRRLPLARKLHIVSGSFLFFAYIGLCVILPRAHPFAKYTMFNKFQNATYVYQLRDKNNQIIPLSQYTTFHNDELNSLSAAINIKHKLNEDDQINGNKIVSDELMRHLSENLNQVHLPIDSIYIYRLSFTLKNNKSIMDEKLLGTYQAY